MTGVLSTTATISTRSVSPSCGGVNRGCKLKAYYFSGGVLGTDTQRRTITYRFWKGSAYQFTRRSASYCATTFLDPFEWDQMDRARQVEAIQGIVERVSYDGTAQPCW
jgi:hypothetical protein